MSLAKKNPHRGSSFDDLARLDRPTRRTYAIRNGILTETTDERKKPIFYGRIDVRRNWTDPHK